MIMLFFVRPAAERRSVLPSLLFPDEQEHDDGGGDQKQRQKREQEDSPHGGAAFFRLLGRIALLVFPRVVRPGRSFAGAGLLALAAGLLALAVLIRRFGGGRVGRCRWCRIVTYLR